MISISILKGHVRKRLSFLTLISILSLTAALQLSGSEQSAGELKAGASKVCINPPDNLFLSGVAYFDFPSRDFIGIHDSIFVRSIVIDNGITKAAFISMDIAKVPSGMEFLEAITADLGIQLEHLILSATHDHNTIEFKGEDYKADPRLEAYYALIREATILSLKEADASLQPARVGFATGKAYVNTNRDEKIGEGYHMGYNPEGTSDKTVTVMTFTALSGKPIAVYANYPVHGVVMYRARTRDGHPEITGDLPGMTSRYVEDRLEGTVALWTSGAAGDQNPLFMANYNQDAPDVHDMGAAGYALLDVQARRLGEEIVRLVHSVQHSSSSVQIWGKQTSVTVPGRQRKYPADPNVPSGGYLAPAHIEMIDGDAVTIPLHLLMINDIAVAGVSAEVFTEIGMHLKDASRFDRTFMVTLLPNDIGYIPTDAAYLMPSEKAIRNRIKPGYAEPAMVDAFIGLMDEYLSGRNTVSSK